MTALEMLMRGGLATGLGIAIGIERAMALPDGRSANHVVGLHGRGAVHDPAHAFQQNADPTRVAAQIVTGIGFLGAGVIMKLGRLLGVDRAPAGW